MKVAIIGAGLSGLSCALELKKNGIIPDIFEKRDSVGHMLGQTTTTFRMFNPSFADPLKRLKSKFNIDATPLYTLNEVVMHGPSKKVKVKGKLGYVFKRGIEDFSLENQIARMVDLPIILNTIADVNKIKNKYDYVIVATGDGSSADSLNLWNTTLTVNIRVATIIGNFELGKMQVWINKSYSKDCYSYMLPTTAKDASLVFIVNDSTLEEFEYNWKEFLFIENNQHNITETRDWNLRIGNVDTLIYENIYFTGNTAGLNDDFLGFGIIPAIESGVYAARSILKNKDYIKLNEKHIKNVQSVHKFRLAYNEMENKDIDKMITLIKAPVLKQTLYNNPLFKARSFSLIPKACKDLSKK